MFLFLFPLRSATETGPSMPCLHKGTAQPYMQVTWYMSHHGVIILLKITRMCKFNCFCRFCCCKCLQLNPNGLRYYTTVMCSFTRNFDAEGGHEAHQSLCSYGQPMVVCLCSILLNADRQARKRHVLFFNVFGLTRPTVKPPTSQTHSGLSNR